MILDTSDGSYTVADASEREFATMKFAADQQGAGIAKMRAKMGKVTVQETGVVQTIGIWTASRFHVRQDKSFDVDVWVAREAGSEEWRRWTRDYPVDEMGRRWDATQLGGLAVRMEGTMTVGGLSLPFASSLVGIDSEPIPPEVFVLPAGFEKSKFGVWIPPGRPDKKSVQSKPPPAR